MSPEVHLGGSLVLRPALPLVGAAVVVAALVAVMVLVAWRWPLVMARGRRTILTVLRALVVAAVAMLLFGPEVRWKGRREVAGEVAVLVDATRSMAIRDAVAGGAGEQGKEKGTVPSPATVPAALSRIDAVRFAFLAAREPYTNLAARSVINPYAFGTRVRPIGDFAPNPADPRTDVAEALGAMVRRSRERGTAPFSEKPQEGTVPVSSADIPSRLAAVVLISDGRANRSRGSAEEFARLLAAGRPEGESPDGPPQGVKVHTVGVGSGVPTDRVRDVAVRDLRAPERVFVGNRPEVRGVVATLGLQGKAVEAVLTLNGKEVERRRLVPASNQTAQELVFTPTVEAVGLARLALAVEPLPDELMPTNNRSETTVRVEPGGIRVLYLDGRIHPEGKYVARALGEANELELDRRILVGGAAGLGAAPAPADLDAPSVVILGDLPASALPRETIARLAERVRTGDLGLLTLGGLAAYGPGGWAATPLAEVLPFAVRDGDGQVPGPVRFVPASAGRQHFIFSAGAADGRPMDFSGLAPLAGASAVGPLHPTARLLAESADGRPLLAIRDLARSRVASLTVDTTWQWILAPGSAAGPEIHRRFWRQLVLWVAGRDAPPKTDLWVTTDRPRYVIADPDSPPQAEVTVHAPGGGEPRVRLTGPAMVDVRLEPVSGGGANEWRAMVPLGVPGEYTATAEAGIGAARLPARPAGGPDGQAARRAETRFVVQEMDYEWAEVLADHENLRRIAQAGGGTFREVRDLGRLLEELADLPPQRLTVERRLPLASGRVFLGVVLALLAAEWALRRKWGAA